MPQEGIQLVPHEGVLAFEEIAAVTRVAVAMGVDKVRLTGGEPLVRRGIVKLVAMLASIQGIADYAMTTNGVLLAEFAKSLADAGLQRVNISLDTVDPARYAEITRGGDIRGVLAGIEAAIAAGLVPVKLNCVVRQTSSEPEARRVAEYARERGLTVRFIRQMDMGRGLFWPVEGGSGGRCGSCNRLRLTSEGMVRPCLFSDLAFNVRELGAEAAIRQAVAAKPPYGTMSHAQGLYRIGG
jgi:cyclic pyranopterin phosphate synthase